MEEIRLEFEKTCIIPDYASWCSSSNTYRWKKWDGVDCPEVNDLWEAFLNGWEACQSKTKC